ncbi:LPS export ABC transporter periplasmic protein LptC [Rhodobaculum claviforme]|uniref:LPS export ABC transporter periplasmic protein LptC n=1 Tax=Rhodobaculum claviforme TaxID=1549854 RepID=A0A934TND1_9RHOB|nr:LPS export ABC transporter periplasmic protein LptC [Rhodobaculum claviforme]MBK5928776.1 LPS export ABC transporter periplasmic protein LptC [Rhodobaculum claviforme]
MAYGAGLWHSRTVAGLRLVLPLASVVLLSMLFLLSREIDPSRAVPTAAVDAEDLARDPRILASRLSSVTVDGTEVEMTAATLRIAAGGREQTEAEDVTARLTAPDGRENHLTARRATVDGAAEMMTLAGAVTMTDGSGYTLRSERMLIALDRSSARSPGPVQADGPLGRIDAGAMALTLTPVPGGPATHQLRFEGGVRLIHQPEPGE